MKSRWICLTVAAVSGVLAYVLCPETVDAPARRALVLFVVAAIFWATEVVPLYATSLAVVAAAVLFLATDGGLSGVPGPSGPIRARTFLDPFGSNIIMLFMGGLVLSTAVSRHGLDRAIAARVLEPFTDRPLMLIYAVLGITAFLSMWMSNTATAAMMLAILVPVLKVLEGRGKLAIAVSLAVPLGANIGGIGTPVGTPPNAIALAALRSAGFEISFLRWMLMAVPLMLLLLAITGALLYRLFPGPPVRPSEPNPPGPGTGALPTRTALTPGTSLKAGASLKAGTSLTPGGWGTLAVMLAAIVAWLTAEWHGVEDGTVALTAAAVLAVSGLVTRDDIRGIEWPVLILMWGGLTLGLAMQQSGLMARLSDLPLAKVQGVVLAGMVVLTAMFVSTFISNTATAALLVPIVLAFALPERGQLVVLGALSCSFAMAMPVSTPPNALVFATGRITAQDLLRAGGLMSVIAVAIVLAGYPLMLPLVLPAR